MKRVDNITILYVEDEEGAREVLASFLKRYTSNLHVAVDGLDGLEQYKKYNPDIIISDIKMPRMSGLDMVKEIKEIDPKAKIIFTTAHSESSYFLEAIEKQVEGYILKPIDLKLLHSKIVSITEYIELQRNSRTQELFMKQITEHQKNMIILMDDKREVLFVNKYCLDFFQVDDLENFLEEVKDISSEFIESTEPLYDDDSEIHWIEQAQEINETDRVASMFDKQGKLHTFSVSISKIEENNHFVVTMSQITKLHMQKTAFEQKAYTDKLTNIANRAKFDEILLLEIEKFKETLAPLSLIIFDIDHFKKFNDTYGHQIGDEVLIELASVVTSRSRDSDTFARWGGEEFVYLLPQTSIKDAEILAQDIRSIIQKHTFVNDLSVTCSFGVSQLYENDEAQTFVKKADKALYIAKDNGRNRVEICKESSDV